ncbi:MAG: DUF6171 family protein [Treponemataceae bacterium]|nr:DUF6171 family protein [Treponemataceae bacterium]
MRPPCPQCEAQRALLESGSVLSPDRLAELADSLNNESASDPAIAAVDEQKRRREICRQCESLAGGAMCSWCGCYIALRARGTAATCPYPRNDKWKTE